MVQFAKTCRLDIVNQWNFIDFFPPKDKLTHKVLYTKNRAPGKQTLPERKYCYIIAISPSLVCSHDNTMKE